MTIETKKIKTNNIELHVAFCGPENGEPVFLLHGFPDFWFCWEEQMYALAQEGFRVIAPDQRGFNLSDKPSGIEAYAQKPLVEDIIGLADALGYQQFNLAGHDFGGLVSWGLATLHPKRISKMVILSAPHLLASIEYNKTHFSQKLKSWYVAFFQLPFLPEQFIKAFDYKLLAQNMSKELSAEALNRYKEAWAQPDGLTSMLNWYRGLMKSINNRDIEYGLVDIPTHIIWGDEDKYLEVGLGNLSLEQCSNGKLTIFEGTSHWVMTEKSQEVSELLLKHFKA